MFIDYYKVLEVPDNSSLQEIKDKYRKLAKKYHPDRNPEGAAKSKMQSINEAYSILSESKARALYDVERANFINTTGQYSNQKADANSFSFDENEQLKEWIRNAKKNAENNKVGITIQQSNFNLIIFPYVFVTLVIVGNIVSHPYSKKISVLKTGYFWAIWVTIFLLFIAQFKFPFRALIWSCITTLSISLSILLYKYMNDIGPLVTVNLFLTTPCLIITLRQKNR